MKFSIQFSFLLRLNFELKLTPLLPIGRRSTMNDLEVEFAKQISEYLERQMNENRMGEKLAERFLEMIEQRKDQSFLDSWRLVAALLETPLAIGVDVKQQRNSSSFRLNLVEASLKYLQQQ